MSFTTNNGLKYSINKAENLFTYYVYKEIGGENGIPGHAIAMDIDAARFYMPDCTRVAVRINSPGGSLIDGLSVYNAIKNSSIPVDTYVDGIAASIAGVIAMAGVKRYMNDFARIMVHDPAIDAADLSDKDREALAQLKGVLVSIFEKNSAMTPDVIDTLMKNETWFDADQAFAAGLIDSIIKTDKRAVGKATNVINAYNLANQLIATNDMTKIKSILNLDETATDETIDAAVETLVTEKETNAAALIEQSEKVADLESQISQLKAENENLKTAAAIGKNAAAILVDSAIADGRIKAENRVEMLTIAENSIETFSQMLAAIRPALPGNVMNIVKTTENAVEKFDETSGKYDGKTLRELEKSDPKTVADLAKNNAGIYEKMYFAQYGVNPKNNGK